MSETKEEARLLDIEKRVANKRRVHGITTKRRYKGDAQADRAWLVAMVRRLQQQLLDQAAM